MGFECMKMGQSMGDKSSGASICLIGTKYLDVEIQGKGPSLEVAPVGRDETQAQQNAAVGRTS